MKICPVCAIDMTPLLVSGNTVIDYCKRCHGVWFDAKELEAIHREDEVLQTLLKSAPVHMAPLSCRNCQAGNPRNRKTCDVCNADLRLECPACKNSLHEIKVGTLAADRCEKCRGVWLDGGELTDLFREYQGMVQRNKKDGKRFAAGDAAAAAGEFTLYSMLWAPDLVFYTAYGVGRLAASLPSTAVDAASHLPEIASGAFEATSQFAGTAMEVTSSAAEGLSDLFSSFLELLAGLFD